MDGPIEKRVLGSKAIRKAGTANTREDQNLEKERLRLRRQYQTQADQLKAEQNRFAYQQKRASRAKAIERKTSLTLAPVTTEKTRDVGLSDAKAEQRHRTKSLPLLVEGESTKCDPHSTNLPPLERGSTRLMAKQDTAVSSGSEDEVKQAAENTVSLPTVPQRQRSTSVNTARQNECFSEPWPKIKPQDFYASSLMAKVQFIATLTKFLHDHEPFIEDEETAAGDADDKTELSQAFDEIKYCRYLRKPEKRNGQESREDKGESRARNGSQN